MSRKFDRLLPAPVPNQVKRSLPICVQKLFTARCRAPVSSTEIQVALWPRLRRMVRDGGWTWTDIGRAMTLAGITYASGTPWTGALLNVKMAQARSHLRARDAKREGDDRHAR